MVDRLSGVGASWWVWVVSLVIVWELAWRRSAPLVVFGVCAVGALSVTGTPGTLVGALCAVVALYSVAVRRSLVLATAAAALLVLGLVLVAVHAVQPTMAQVTRTAREALSEMRKLLDVLGDDQPTARQPQPSLRTLEVLLDEFRATGLAVRLERTGDPAPFGPAAEATSFAWCRSR